MPGSSIKGLQGPYSTYSCLIPTFSMQRGQESTQGTGWLSGMAGQACSKLLNQALQAPNPGMHAGRQVRCSMAHHRT